MKCPNCGTGLSMEVQVPPEQRIFIEITSDQAHRMAARTIGETIVDMEKLLRAVGQQAGDPVEVFLDSFNVTDNKVKIGFFVVSNPNQRKQK